MRTMVDMSRDLSEVKRDIAQSVPTPEASAPVYDYGLCISLNENSLKKLGMEDDPPETGDMVHFTGMAKVTSYSESERETTDGKREKCCRVELQITHLGIEDEDREYTAEDRAKSRYGKRDEDEED